MFDVLFGGVLQDLEQAEAAIQGKEIPKGPFINGEDLDWNDEELVKELTEEYGTDPFRGRA